MYLDPDRAMQFPHDLIEQHRLLDRSLDDLLALLDPHTPRIDPALNLRDAFRRRIEHHLHDEAFLSYPDFIDRANQEAGSTRIDFKADVSAIMQRWVDYLERWPTIATPEDWKRFCAESREIILVIKRRIAEETALLEARQFRLH